MMKTGRNGPSLRDYKVELPSEVVALILSYVRRFESEIIQRRTLWSCCLLSRSWYSATVPWLYRSPLLSNQNFDKFARTICPPVNSHVRRVGLESFVCHLDMGHLAYESSRSLTARLLRRAAGSLETFVAPAVSFSIGCLAPLSRCQNLQFLDLSRDFYDIDLMQLLNSVGGLPYLTALSLPKSAMRKRHVPSQGSYGKGGWPMRLLFLQINDLLPQGPTHWAELIASWPQSLVSVAFENCLNWEPFSQLHQSQAKALHIKSLSIGMRREEDGFPIEILLVAFPKLRYMAIPTPVTMPDVTVEVDGWPGKGEDLEHLAFRPAPDCIQPRPRLRIGLLSDCAQLHTRLTKIEIPEAYLDLDDESADILDSIEVLMTARINYEGQESGVFLVEG